MWCWSQEETLGTYSKKPGYSHVSVTCGTFTIAKGGYYLGVQQQRKETENMAARTMENSPAVNKNEIMQLNCVK